jgi:hypothetical protein
MVGVFGVLTGDLCHQIEVMSIPLAALSKASVCGRSLAGIAGSNSAGGVDVCLF